jgi:hypothetical protein
VTKLTLPPADGKGSGLVAFTGSQSPRFRNALLNELRAAIVLPGTAEEVWAVRFGAAMDPLAGFAPRDEVEGMMATQAVALHHAAMDALRRAMRRPAFRTRSQTRCAARQRSCRSRSSHWPMALTGAAAGGRTRWCASSRSPWRPAPRP